jgi:hypothetical protein
MILQLQLPAGSASKQNRHSLHVLMVLQPLQHYWQSKWQACRRHKCSNFDRISNCCVVIAYNVIAQHSCCPTLTSGKMMRSRPG